MTTKKSTTFNKPNDEMEEDSSDFFTGSILRIGNYFALLFIASMLMLIFEIVMRYVFDRPTIWVHETTIFICAMNFVFGGLHSVSRNAHIRVVIVYGSVSVRVRRWLDMVIYSICALATGMFSYAIWPTVIKSFWAPNGEFRIITSGSAWNPPFPSFLRLFLFLVLIAMTVQFLLFVFKHFRDKQK